MGHRERRDEPELPGSAAVSQQGAEQHGWQCFAAWPGESHLYAALAQHQTEVAVSPALLPCRPVDKCHHGLAQHTDVSPAAMQGRMQAEGRPAGLNMYDSAAETGQSAQRSNSNGALVSDCPLLPSRGTSLNTGNAMSLSKAWLVRCCSCSRLPGLPPVHVCALHEHLHEGGMRQRRAGNLQGRNGSGPGMHDFARQGTLAGDASLPSDGDTPHRNGSTPNIGRLQRIGAAQLWQVCCDDCSLT